MATAVADILAGQGGPDLLRSAMAGGRRRSSTTRSWPRGSSSLPLFLRESAVGRDVIPTVVAHSRRRSDIGGLPILLFYVARDQATTDRWDDAVAGYTEAIQLAREAGQATDVTACLAGLVLARGASRRRRRVPGARRGGAGDSPASTTSASSRPGR